MATLLDMTMDQRKESLTEKEMAPLLALQKAEIQVASKEIHLAVQMEGQWAHKMDAMMVAMSALLMGITMDEM